MNKKINNLQALRAFAALNVIFYHIIGTSPSYNFQLKTFDFLTGWGANGVDIFFVISGFVMVYIQKNKPRTPKAFLTDRFFRIVPMYWLLTAVIALLLIFLPTSFRQLQWSPKWLLDCFFIPISSSVLIH